MIDRDAILKQWDKCAEEFVFPMLDNGYTYPGDVRMSVYRDPERWLMIIEALGAHNRCAGHDCISNCLHLYGNALHGDPGTSNDDFLHPTHDVSGVQTFEAEYGWLLTADVRQIKIRDRAVELNLDADRLREKGIQLEEPPSVNVAEMLRSLLPEERNALLATEQELAERNVHGLPLFMRLDEWSHPDLASEEKPSECETFKMLAEAVATGDASLYKPTQPPNTHWRNWPEGGQL